jgi:glycogen operon protein
MRLLLYNRVGDREPTDVLTFDSDSDRWGDVWSLYVPGVKAGQLYHLQADGPYDPEQGLRFDGRARLIDPYARALAGDFQPTDDGIIRPPKCVVMDDDFDWRGDRHLRRSTAETVIYEMHVRGFTRSPSSRVRYPGTYLGIIEKIPYLQSLGITAVELMPVHEFPIRNCWGKKGARPNYWGYDPLAFFSPHRGYAASKVPGAQVREFKEMVRALHAAGIEVILDVVFNHTSEGNEYGPTLSFKGLQNNVYYMLADGGKGYKNYSGCGNTVNGNHPIVREMIFLCLRHWVLNYHIDGFRFDLASILSRDRQGHLVPNPPLVEMIAEDPLLADTKIIAEAWDAAGAYQVGSFGSLRWAEWNGRYRDDARRYWRGDAHMTSAMATRLAGSSDLYQSSGRKPYHSINFITSHDGFTLNDLVSYSQKHNEANGEENRDGDNNNYSDNFGFEGPTRRATISRVRLRQIKNMIATLMLSHGVPMLVSGDECRRTQRGNNNAYCQDNAISWFDWKLIRRSEDLLRFTRHLIAFRNSQPAVRRATFLTGKPTGPNALPDVSWFDAQGQPFNWEQNSRGLTCVFGATDEEANSEDDRPSNGNHLSGSDRVSRDVMILMQPDAVKQRFLVPEEICKLGWRMFVDTAAPSPEDVHPLLDGPSLPPDGKLVMSSWSLRCYVTGGPVPEDAAVETTASK